MTALDLSSPAAVAAAVACAMGRGTARAALVAGHSVRRYDAAPGRAREAADAIGARLDRPVERPRLTALERDAARARRHPGGELTARAACHLGANQVPGPRERSRRHGIGRSRSVRDNSHPCDLSGHHAPPLSLFLLSSLHCRSCASDQREGA